MTTLDSTLDDLIIPALWERADEAFPELGFERKGEKWIATREADALIGQHARPDRVQWRRGKASLIVQGGAPAYVSVLALVGYRQGAGGRAFIEALQELARRAGVKLPEREETPEQRRGRERAERVQDAREAFVRAAHEALLAPGGDGTRAYLLTRGLNCEALTDLGVGLALEAGEMRAAMLALGAPEGEIRECRLGAHEHRIVFPWRDARGRLAGWASREMGQS